MRGAALLALSLLCFVVVPSFAFAQDPLDVLADELASAYFATEDAGSSDAFQLASATTTSSLDPVVQTFENEMGRRPGWVRGRTVLQMGFSRTQDAFDGIEITDTVAPDMLLRYRIVPRLEFRLGWAGWTRSNASDTLIDVEESHTTTSDVNVGLGLRLWQQRRILPATGLLVSLPIETDGNPFALRSFLPTTELGYGWELNERWYLAGASGLILLDDDEESTSRRYTQSISLSRMFGERVSLYGDLSALLDGTSDELSFTGGGYFQMTDRFGVSGFAGLGLNDLAPDSQLGVGASWRL